MVSQKAANLIAQMHAYSADNENEKKSNIYTPKYRELRQTEKKLRDEIKNEILLYINDNSKLSTEDLKAILSSSSEPFSAYPSYLTFSDITENFDTIQKSSENKIKDLFDIVISLLNIVTLDHIAKVKAKLILMIVKFAESEKVFALFLQSCYRCSFPGRTLISEILAGDLEYIPLIERYLNYRNYEEETKAQITQNLLISALKFKNAALVQVLQKHHTETLQNQNISVADRMILNQLLQVKDPLFFSAHMLSLTQGFGKITHDEALVTLAQIAKRKKLAYDFHPTLFEEYGFAPYLEIIKSAKRPCNEIFMLSGDHWLSGKIQIDEKGGVNILLIDPMNSKDFSLEDPSTAISTMNMLKTITQAFPQPYSVKLFIDTTERQMSTNGCQVFAIDDARHLYTAPNYLDEKYQADDNGFFQYLIDKTSPQEITTFAGMTVYSAEFLPPSMIRTMQSRKLMTKFLPRYHAAERELPVKKTKPGENPVTVNTLIHDNKDFELDAQAGKMQNQRLKHSLAKMARYDYEYLLATPSEQVKQDAKKFSLEGLKKNWR